MVTKLQNAVVGTLPAVEAFDAVLAEQLSDITRSADLLVNVERAETDVLNASAGIADLLFGVLTSQCESVLNGLPFNDNTDKVSLGWYDAVRLSWGDAYRSAKGANVLDNTVNQGWSRSFKLVSDAYGLSKPKAETAGAEKKAEQRAKQEEKMAAYIDKPVQELKDKARALFDKAADGGKDAPKLRAEANLISKVIEKQASEANKAQAELVKELKASIKELLKEVSDTVVLAEVESMLQGSVDDSQAELDI